MCSKFLISDPRQSCHVRVPRNLHVNLLMHPGREVKVHDSGVGPFILIAIRKAASLFPLD
jgi:hypothetical protein